MRLFIAILPDERTKDRLAAVQAELKSKGVKGRFAERENLHMTLAFLGERDDPAPAFRAMEALAFSPFPLTLEGAGRFGPVVWAGAEKSEALYALVRALRRALAEEGVPFDKKHFSPHVTLARTQDARPLPGLSPFSAAMTVSGIALMRSDRGPRGMRYTQIGFVHARNVLTPSSP